MFDSKKNVFKVFSTHLLTVLTAGAILQLNKIKSAYSRLQSKEYAQMHQEVLP